MSLGRAATATTRSLFIALAMLALVFKVSAPQGYMIAAGGSFPLVICTGHGPATIGVDRSSRSHKAPADKARPPCGFAGNVLADLADAPHPFASRAVAFAAPASGFAVEPDPGRGLAAPPPPSQGPPVLL